MGFQLMLEQANSFYVCAKMCGNKMKKLEGRIDIYATPMIVNLSFACEVYIKTLLDYLENGSKKSHKLNELLEALPDEKKSRILKEVEAASAQNGKYNQADIKESYMELTDYGELFCTMCIGQTNK